MESGRSWKSSSRHAEEGSTGGWRQGVGGPKDPSSLIYAAMLFTEYEDTQIVVKPPAFVLRLLAFVGRRLGYRLD